MGARGELFTTQVLLDNRAYFFNVKENRAGDIFLQIVESKSRDGADFDRHQVAIFADDLQRFLQGLDKSLSFIDKERVDRVRRERISRQKQDANISSKNTPPRAQTARTAISDGVDSDVGSDEEKERIASGIKKTGKVIHIVSKRAIPPKA